YLACHRIDRVHDVLIRIEDESTIQVTLNEIANAEILIHDEHAARNLESHERAVAIYRRRRIGEIGADAGALPESVRDGVVGEDRAIREIRLRKEEQAAVCAPLNHRIDGKAPPPPAPGSSVRVVMAPVFRLICLSGSILVAE